jgi:hypothetical protein
MNNNSEGIQHFKKGLEKYNRFQRQIRSVIYSDIKEEYDLETFVIDIVSAIKNLSLPPTWYVISH